jgi:membrane protein required for colicin V production
MQSYDILMLIVLVGAVLFGVWKGAAWQAASLASIVLSALVAVHSSPAVAPWFGKQEPWNRILAMLVLYVVTAAAIWIVFRLVSNIIDRIQLKEFDRQLGGIIGLAKGVLYCVIITFFVMTLFESESPRQLVLQSRSGDWIARGIRNANPILPEDVRKYLGKYIDELDAKLHPPPGRAVPGDSSGVAPGAAPASPAPTAPPAAGQDGKQKVKETLKDLLPKLK